MSLEMLVIANFRDQIQMTQAWNDRWAKMAPFIWKGQRSVLQEKDKIRPIRRHVYICIQHLKSDWPLTWGEL